MAESVADADFERRARLALVWQDLVTPVRAIVGYQEIAIEEGRRLGLTDELPFLEKALVAAGSLSAMVNRLRDPGRTTVILQSAATGKRGKVAGGAWGAATWGEQTDAKSWMRLNAYGLAPAPGGKAYQFWFVSASGDSVLAGKLEPNTEGGAFVEGKDLPGVDQGKMAVVSLDDENAKTHGQPLFQAELPKLTPSQHAAPQTSRNTTPTPPTHRPCPARTATRTEPSTPADPSPSSRRRKPPASR